MIVRKRYSRTENTDYVVVYNMNTEVLKRQRLGSHIETSRGRRVRLSGSYRSSIAGAALLERYPNLPIIRNTQVVPTCVAVYGKTAIAAYVTSIQGLSKYQAAEELEVEVPTVTKYIKRFYDEVRS